MPGSQSTASEKVRAAASAILRGGCFFVAGRRRLRIERRDCESVPWEVFRGHLLDPAHARQVTDFESWNVFLDDVELTSLAPLASVLWQHEHRRVYVARRILTHGFEAYEDSPGVILSRPTQKWVAELVGTIELEGLGNAALERELATYVLLAVIGTSRLPITSLESPLPGFSLGQLGYVPGLAESDDAWRDPPDFLRAALVGERPIVHQVKALETALRAASSEQVAAIADVLGQAAKRHATEPDWLPRLFRALFQGAALSPYTEFVDRLIGVLMELTYRDLPGGAVVIDILSYMLRHLCRHLTAFDLSVFHNFGANYPDALFLDALLTAYLRLIDAHPALFERQNGDASAVEGHKRRRRRALRQACLVRKRYEGHPVPDAPTSMGENARVFPASFVRVPEEQIVDVSKRRRKLFDTQPLESQLSERARRVLWASLADLENPIELRELGMAQFLARPLGLFKQPGEVDRTPLLSYEAFGRLTAKARLGQIKSAGWIGAETHGKLVPALEALPVTGVAADAVAVLERPAVVSLADARRAATDFVFLRTTRGSLAELLAHYDLRPLAAAAPETCAWLTSAQPKLLVEHAPQETPRARSTLRICDSAANPRLEIGFGQVPGTMARYRERGGVELVESLFVLRIREPLVGAQFKEHELGDRSIRLDLRSQT